MEATTELIETAWGDIVPWTDYPAHDVPGWSSARLGFPDSRLDDRIQGRFRPFYENEQDLRRIRGEARRLATFASSSVGALEALGNYVLGDGPSFTAQSDIEGSERLVAGVQAAIDRFLAVNDFRGDLDREIHNRSREDGEVFAALYPGATGPRVCLIEPDQVTEPRDPRALEDWLGVGHEPTFWHFGIHTRLDPHMRCEDVAHPLGYHVVFDNLGNDWDYLPADRVQFLKRLPNGITRNARRGISDFFPVQRDMEREAKLASNTAEGAAIQAAIALIVEHPEGTSSGDVEAQINANSDTDYKVVTKSGSTRTVQVQKFRPGTVYHGHSGKKVQAGPLGTLRSPIFIEVAAFLLRKIAIRWSMPEYMISSDASNANFASTLVAESPFVKARQNDQAFYAMHFRNLVWKALYMEFQRGVFDRHKVTWPELRETVEIDVEFPEVASRDRLQQAQVGEIENRLGLVSKQTLASEAGRDYEAERQKIAEEPPAPGMGGALQGAVQGALESVETSEEARAILARAWRSYP